MYNIIILFVLILNITNCNFNFQNKYKLTDKTKTLKIITNKQLNYFIQFLINQIKLNNIKLLKINDDTNSPTLKIISLYKDIKPLSLFQNGKILEKQLSYIVNAELTMCNGNKYPLIIKVNRVFFDNSLKILAKDSEEDIILKEIQEEAVHNLIKNITLIYSYKF